LVSGEKVCVYTLKKGIKDTIIYDEKGVRERFGFGPELLPDYKGLRGDPSDNIIGIKGVGEKTATILINTFGGIDGIYKALKKGKEKFIEAGITPRMIELLETGKEDAEFSKVLATIRRDAPIDWKLPAQRWQDSVDMEAASKLFAALEFRTMTSRLKTVLGQKPEDKTVEAEEVKAEMFRPEISTDSKKFKEAALMLWLVNSNLTDPKPEDILNFTQTNSLDAAYSALEKAIDSHNQRSVYEEIEKPLIPIVDRMKEVGVKIDVKIMKSLADEFGKELASLEKSIWRQADQEFNISSPKQLGEILFVKMGLIPKRAKKTAGGAFSTKESELEKIADMHPIVNDVLRYRELSKLMGTYVEAIPRLVDDRGRIHPTFIQSGAATGRMASKDPGIQNIPNRTEEGRRIRTAFIAEKGWKLVSLDYSQIELRIAAFLSGDKKMIDIFKRNEDIHAAVASEIYGIPADKITKTMRSHAKTVNFGVMYGMGVTALQKNMGTDRATAQKFLNDYFERFSGLASYLDRVKAEAARNGYTETLYGRRRYFEGMKSKLPFIRAAAERMAINAPIQGTEADIVKIAMIHIDEYLTKMKLHEDVRAILQVHDELVYEVREDAAEMFAKKAKEIMENIVPLTKTAGIVCVAEAYIGKDWVDMEAAG
jgi:DNA polymerase-1